jgi:glycerophosphoryl diester phosphodiesterase
MRPVFKGQKQPLIFAHRGASAHAPENTLAAFSKAYESGADGIELDIQMSSDQEIFVFHDYTLKRICAVDRPLDQMTAEELQTMDAGSWFSADFKHEKNPKT